jgi:hypothetical protein
MGRKQQEEEERGRRWGSIGRSSRLWKGRRSRVGEQQNGEGAARGGGEGVQGGWAAGGGVGRVGLGSIRKRSRRQRRAGGRGLVGRVEQW